MPERLTAETFVKKFEEDPDYKFTVDDTAGRLLLVSSSNPIIYESPGLGELSIREFMNLAITLDNIDHSRFKP